MHAGSSAAWRCGSKLLVLTLPGIGQLSTYDIMAVHLQARRLSACVCTCACVCVFVHAPADALTASPPPARAAARPVCRSTERVFPQVPDVESPEFFRRMDLLVQYNQQLVDIGRGSAPDFVKQLQRLPVMQRMAAEMLQIFLMKPKDCGSYDLAADKGALVF